VRKGLLVVGFGVVIAGAAAALLLQPARPEFAFRIDLGVKSWDSADPFESGVAISIGDATFDALPGTWTVSTGEPGPLRPLPAGRVPPVLDGDAFAAFLTEVGLDPDGEAEFRPYEFLDLDQEYLVWRDVETTAPDGGRTKWLLLFLRLGPGKEGTDEEMWWYTDLRIDCDRPLTVKAIQVSGTAQETTTVRDRLLRLERTTVERSLRFFVTGHDGPIEVRREAATALGMIGIATPEVRAALTEASAADDPNLAARASAALRRIDAE